MTSKPNTPTRRDFLTRDTGIAAVTATIATSSLTAANKPAAKPGARVIGANDRINIAFIGNGMQFGTLVRIFKNRKQEKNDVHFAACCDVWEPRLKYGIEQSGAEKAYRDYREVLARTDIDGVVLAVPDHWHYPMASQALLAGKRPRRWSAR